MSFDNRERKDYFKSCAKIAKDAMMMMSELWEQIEFESDEPFVEVFDNYPFEKSFDEVVAEFMFWIEEWDF